MVEFFRLAKCSFAQVPPELSGECVVGKAKTAVNESVLLSGISSVVDRIRQDAYNGDFDDVFERHSLTAVAVTGRVQAPTFLCQPGHVLRRHICGTVVS